MALTVHDVLKLEVFRRAEPEVVAGTEHLGRRVRWVHITELPDIAYLLKGGELLLTTGMGLGRDGNLHRRYVRELAETGVAGVVVELGRTFWELPRTMVEEAEACELPLIALHRETRYVEVTEAVHSAIINRQYELLQKAERIGREFTDLVLEGASLSRVVHRLAGIVEDPVILEDAAHQVVEFATHRTPIDEVLEVWEGHSRTGHQETEAETLVRLEGDPTSCAWAEITLRGDPWGRVHVLNVDSPIDEMDGLALDRAVAAIGLTLLADRDADHLSDHARGALLSDVLHGRYESTEEIFRRAKGLGADLEGKRLIALAVELRDLSDLVTERELSERDRQQIRADALAEMKKAISAADLAGLAALDGDRVLAVAGLEEEDSIRQTAANIAERMAAGVARGVEGLETIIGVSDEIGPESLRRGFDQAMEAARYGVRMQAQARTYHFCDLGLHHLLLRLSDGPELARFVEAELNPILEHDAKSATPLLPTLRTYVNMGGSKSAAARALHIERRSLYYRLERISRLLGRTLDDTEARTRLVLALHGLELLQSRAHARPGDGAKHSALRSP